MPRWYGNRPISFNGLSLRTVKIDGEPWFVAKDVCDVLHIQNPARAVAESDLGAEEYRTFNVGLRGKPPLIVSESGLYALIMRSRKPEAKAFRRRRASGDACRPSSG